MLINHKNQIRHTKILIEKLHTVNFRSQNDQGFSRQWAADSIALFLILLTSSIKILEFQSVTSSLLPCRFTNLISSFFHQNQPRCTLMILPKQYITQENFEITQPSTLLVFLLTLNGVQLLFYATTFSSCISLSSRNYLLINFRFLLYRRYRNFLSPFQHTSRHRKPNDRWAISAWFRRLQPTSTKNNSY